MTTPTVSSRPISQPSGGNVISNWWRNSSPEERTSYINAGANAVGSYLDNRQRSKDREQAAQTDAARLEQQRREAQTSALLTLLDRERQQQKTALDASQMTPARQDWRQRQAMLSAILSQLRNAQVTPPGDLARFMPQMSGGLRLPEGGFSTDTLAAFSPQQRLAAEADLDRSIAQASGGTAPGTDYAAFYGDSPQTQALAGSIRDYSGQVRQQTEQRQQQILAQILGGGSGGTSAASPFPRSSGATPSAVNALTGLAGQIAVARDQQPAHVQAGGDPAWGATYWEQLTNAALATDAQSRPVKPRKYEGGSLPPRAEQLDVRKQSTIRANFGVDPKLKEQDGKQLLQSGWRYGQPAPKGFEYSDDGLLKKRGSVWKTIGKVAAIGGATVATIATAGAASPGVAALVGAGSGALVGGMQGGWKGALTGAALGGVTGGVGAGISQSALNVGQKIAAQSAVGAGTGAVQGGGRGALLGGLAAGGGTAIGAAGQQMAHAGRPLAQQIAAQAGMQAALGGATGGREGAFYGGLGGAAGSAFSGPASNGASRDRQFWAMLAQRSPQLYQALHR